MQGNENICVGQVSREIKENWQEKKEKTIQNRSGFNIKDIAKYIIYTRKCLGKDGKEIKIYKIRTMVLDADKRLEERVVEYDSYGHLINDSRVTPIGRFLRKYWIDEIPQIYNLLRGDLKLVGVRPHSEEEWKRFPRSLKEKALRQKPGLIGFQYAYPKESGFEQYIKNLREYLEEWEKDPVKTDRKYLYKALKNILCKGVRST